MPGLFIETSMMLPAAATYYVFFASSASNLLENSVELNALLLFAGVMTTAPLLCFTAAARRIKYGSLGMIQYIGPSLMFILAITIYKESLSIDRLITFVMVWIALAIFSYDSLANFRKNRPRKPPKPV
jgi:chloramphenicol-sensitive protein RarD